MGEVIAFPSSPQQSNTALGIETDEPANTQPVNIRVQIQFEETTDKGRLADPRRLYDPDVSTGISPFLRIVDEAI